MSPTNGTQMARPLITALLRLIRSKEDMVDFDPFADGTEKHLIRSKYFLILAIGHLADAVKSESMLGVREGETPEQMEVRAAKCEDDD